MLIKEELLRLMNGKISKTTLKEIEPFIFAFCIFLITPVFYLWNSINPLYFVIICTILSLKNIVLNSPKHYIFFFASILFYLYISYMDGLNIFGFSAIMCICTLLITSPAFYKNVFNKYVLIFSITLIPSLISFLLVYLVGINLPHSFIEPLNPMKSYDYISYPFLVTPNNILDLIIPRFSGYYDEPGVIGTIAGVIMICNGFDLKKKINIPIFIAGLLSFSLAFYIISIVYGYFFLSSKYKVILTSVIIGSVILLSSNEIIDEYLFSRFKIEDGKLAGNSRTADESFESQYKEFSKSDDYYFGFGNNASKYYDPDGASYKNLIFDYGIVPFVYFVGILVLLAFFEFKFSKEFFLTLFIFFSVIYQRPFITTYFYMFLVFAPVSALSKPVYNK